MPYPKLLRLLALGFVAGSLITPSFAQATDEAETEEAVKPPPGFVLPPRLRQIAYREANPWTFHFNARYNTGKPSVEFGGLGNMPSIHNLPGADQTDVLAREYDDGGVLLDGPRTNEVDADGNQTSTPGGRYQALPPGAADDSDVYLDLLSYTPGQTRYWRYLDDSQRVGDNGIAMHAYSAQSTGATAQMEHDGSAIGFEMAVGRRILSLGPKLEVGFNASIGLTDITAERNERVVADLVTLTDIYQIYGDFPGTPYQSPTYTDLFNDLGNLILQDGVETSVPLQQVTADRTISVTPNGAFVDGTYKVKGAYYSIRLGPEIRSHLTERLALTAGFGFVGAYVGSDFTVTEVLDTTNLTVLNGVGFTDTKQYKDFIAGYYGEIAVEFWLTPRTALFLGGAFESLDEFVQSVGGQTATISLGNNLIVRIGVITRF